MNPILRNILAVIIGIVVGMFVNMGLIMISGSVIAPARYPRAGGRRRSRLRPSRILRGRGLARQVADLRVEDQGFEVDPPQLERGKDDVDLLRALGSPGGRE